MSEPGIRYAVEDGIASIVLDRPKRSNSIDLATAAAFADAIERAREDAQVRVVLLTGAGKRFCAGGDVDSMSTSPDPAVYLFDLATRLDLALQQLASLDKPVVAGVQGAAAGAGLAVLLAADVVICAESTRFLTAYAGVGLTPDCGLSWLLPRAIGQQRALELALTGRVLQAAEARDWGLVTAVVPDGEVGARAREMAARLASGSPFALGQARRLVRQSWTLSRAEAGAEEARTISGAVTTPEAKKLIAAFTGR